MGLMGLVGLVGIMGIMGGMGGMGGIGGIGHLAVVPRPLDGLETDDGFWGSSKYFTNCNMGRKTIQVGW